MTQSNPRPDFVDEAATVFPDITEEYSVLNALSSQLLASRKTDGLERAVLFQCGIAWQHYHAILLLLSRAFGVQSLLLCRTLFELTVSTLYLLKERSLSQDFLDHGKLTLYQQAMAANQEAAALKLPEIDLAPLRAECEKIRDRFKTKKGNGVLPWHRSKISEMARAVGFDWLYKNFYPDASDAAHSDATKTLSYSKRGWKQSLRRFHSEQECDRVSYMSFQLMGQLFFRANEALEMGHDKEANAVMLLVLHRAKCAAMPN